jgi:hypothetical protein
MFDERIETKTLLGSIKARREKGELPTKILEAIEDIISESKKDKIFDELDLNLMTSRVVMFCTVKNDSTSLVREAKLVLPGEGQAEISEATIMSPEVKRLNWSGQIVIGDMRPKSTVEVKVWFKTIVMGNLNLVNPAVVYAGGTGEVMEVRGFYGWGADAATLFLSFSRPFLIAAVCIIIAGLVLLIWVAVRRGHIVMRPMKRNGGIS